MEALAYDLDVVQRYCGVHFPVPDSVDPLERLTLRFARLLIEGHCVNHPGAQIVSLELEGTASPELLQLLNGKPQSIKVEQGDFTISFAGHELCLGHVALFHTQLAAEDHQAIGRALDRGESAGMPVRLRPVDGRYFRAYMPDKITDPDRKLIPTPLGLTGFAEPEPPQPTDAA